MTEFKIVAQFSHPHEAHLAKSKLEASGILVFIQDEHTVNMNWLYSNVIGGVKLRVPQERLRESLEILKTDFSSELEATFGKITTQCPYCESENFSPHTEGKTSALLTILLFGLPLMFVRNGYKCRDCGGFWKRGCN